MTRDLSIPLGAYREITMRFPEQQFTETDWQIMLDVLKAMRPALVEPDVVDASVLDVHDLTPDERIEVARAIRRLAETTGQLRDARLLPLADRLDWQEREPA